MHTVLEYLQGTIGTTPAYIDQSYGNTPSLSSDLGKIGTAPADFGLYRVIPHHNGRRLSWKGYDTVIIQGRPLHDPTESFQVGACILLLFCCSYDILCQYRYSMTFSANTVCGMCNGETNWVLAFRTFMNLLEFCVLMIKK